jgi:hypothetical protein
MAKLTANDILGIEQLNARFAMAFDGRLPDPAKEWAGTFTPTGEFILVASNGEVQERAKGTKELVALHDKLANPLVRHWYGNLLIESDGAGARMRCYFISLNTKTLAIQRTATYSDRLVKIKGKWKFKVRTVTLDPGSS